MDYLVVGLVDILTSMNIAQMINQCTISNQFRCNVNIGGMKKKVVVCNKHSFVFKSYNHVISLFHKLFSIYNNHRYSNLTDEYCTELTRQPSVHL